MRLPAPLHFVFGRCPELDSLRTILCMGSGPESQVQAMLRSLRRLRPEAHIVLVCDAACAAEGADERIDLGHLGAGRPVTVASLRARRFDLGVVLINGHWQYWRQWLLATLLGTRSWMVANENGDGFFALPAHLPHLLRTLFGSRDQRPGHGLLATLLSGPGQVLGMAALAVQAMRRAMTRVEVAPAFALPIPHGSDLEMHSAGPRPAGEFTGERFIPGVDPDLELEHVSRYRFALAAVAGCQVLDAGCGEGYGSAVLAQGARSVTAIDVDAATIARAAARYPRPNLRFQHVASEAAWPFAAGSFERITSFEVIEHIPGWQAYLDQCRRVLAPGGVLLISTPNRPYYSGERGEHNEFHVHEFDLAEFQGALRARFPHVRMYAQNHTTGVAIEDLGADTVRIEALRGASGRELATSHYFLAVCSDQPPPPLPGLLLQDDRGNQLRAREQELGLLRQELARARDAYRRLEREFEDRSRWAAELHQELEDLRHQRKAP